MRIFLSLDIFARFDSSVCPRLGLFDQPVASDFYGSFESAAPGTLTSCRRIFAVSSRIVGESYEHIITSKKDNTLLE